MDSSTFNVLSLCSGVGGLDLGVALAVPTARTVCFVEREAQCCEVLAERMEDGCLDEAPIWADLQTFDGKPWRGVVDCVTGGYPCQPFSVAGRRKGSRDSRHLWPEVARIVREVGPAWCFFENVGNHLRLGFEQVHDELSEMGYIVAAGLFSAAEVGASHKRERLFVVGHAGGWGLGQGVHEPGDAREGFPAHRDRFSVPTAGGRRAVPGIPLRTGGQIHPYPPPPDSPVWAEILGEFPELSPAVECDIFGVADGLATWLDRLRACGNGVVPAVAAHAWRTLVGVIADLRSEKGGVVEPD